MRASRLVSGVGPHGAMRTHGTRAKYVFESCRCAACTAANREYMRRLTRVRLEERYGTREPRFVDPDETQEYLVKLSVAGVGLRRVATLTGVGKTAIGDVKAGRRKRIHRETADAILGVCLDERAAGRWPREMVTP